MTFNYQNETIKVHLNNNRKKNKRNVKRHIIKRTKVMAIARGTLFLADRMNRKELQKWPCKTPRVNGPLQSSLFTASSPSILNRILNRIFLYLFLYFFHKILQFLLLMLFFGVNIYFQGIRMHILLCRSQKLASLRQKAPV